MITIQTSLYRSSDGFRPKADYQNRREALSGLSTRVPAQDRHSTSTSVTTARRKTLAPTGAASSFPSFLEIPARPVLRH